MALISEFLKALSAGVTPGLHAGSDFELDWTIESGRKRSGCLRSSVGPGHGTAMISIRSAYYFFLLRLEGAFGTRRRARVRLMPSASAISVMVAPVVRPSENRGSASSRPGVHSGPARHAKIEAMRELEAEVSE